MSTIDRRTSGPRVTVSLPEGAPASHRVAQRLTGRGWRGSLRLWRLVERRWPLPEHAVLRVGGHPMPIDLGQVIGPYLYYGVYERWELEVLERLVRPDTVCVDVGANDGLYTFAMRAATGPFGRVVAIEPQPDLAARLRTLVEAVRGASVSVVPVAVGPSDGSGRLTLFPHHSGLATLCGERSHGGRAIEVPVRRLDGLEDLGTSEIELLKIDVESFEADVLDGASGLFAAGRVRAVLVEVSANHRRVAAALAGLGPDHQLFRVSQVCRRGRYRASLEPLSASEVAERTDTCNLLACRADAVPAITALIRTGRRRPQMGVEAATQEVFA